MERETDPRTIAWAGDVLRLHGAPSDAERLVAALSRLRADPDAAHAIERALRSFPGAAAVPTDDGTRLLVELQGWGQGAGPPPPGWSDVVLRGLRSGDPHAIAMALGRCPPAPSDELAAAVLAHLGSAEPRVRDMAISCMGGHPHPSYEEPLLAALDRGEDDGMVLFANLFGAASALVPRDVLYERVIAHLGAGGSDQARMMALVQALAVRGEGEEGLVAADEVRRLKAAWTAFVAAHRAEVRAGTAIPIEQTDPALLPRSFVFRLESGLAWPPR
jgi:hypothetical protein